jgi:hypothetical protein
MRLYLKNAYKFKICASTTSPALSPPAIALAMIKTAYVSNSGRDNKNALVKEVGSAVEKKGYQDLLYIKFG